MSDAGSARRDHRAGVSGHDPRRARCAPTPSSTWWWSTATRPRARCRSTSSSPRGDEDFDFEARLAGGRARRPADADLHVGHDRAAQGRADHAREHLRDRSLLRRADRVPRRRPDRLLPADGARRRAQRQPLPADALRLHDHLLSGRARGHRVPARGASRPGSSPSRGSGRSSRPASSRCSAALPPSSGRRWRRRSTASLEKVRLEQRGEEVPAELADGVEKADEAVFSKLRSAPRARRARGMQRRAPRRRPPEVIEFFHALGHPARRAVGDVRDDAAPAPAIRRERIKIGTVGPARPRHRDQAGRGRRGADQGRRWS